MTTGASSDKAAPLTPSALRVTRATSDTISLAWQAASGESGPVNYDIYVDGTKIGSTELTTATVAGLAAQTTYAFHLKARDAAGNNSPASNTVRATTPAPGADPVIPTSTGTGPSQSTGTAQPAPTPSSQPRTRLGKVTTVVEGLKIPWGLTFLPDGSALVGERDTGTILTVSPQGQRRAVGIIPGVVPTGGEGGLLGLARSPWFATDRWLYAYHSSSSDNRIVRMDRCGRNYGWPVCEGSCDDSRFVDPVAEWPVAQASPSGVAISGGVAFMASLRGARLWRIPLMARRPGAQKPPS